MKVLKRIDNENKILSAGERIFASVGYNNAKMEDIAAEASITKVTLYNYCKSKENLYFGITFRALQLLIDKYYDSIDLYESRSGLESIVALQKLFIEFCEENFLYSEALLEYFAINRSSSSGKDLSKLTKATQESVYFKKLQHIQNIPFKLLTLEIERGQKDGSVKKDIDPMFMTIFNWSNCIGYIKIISSCGNPAAPVLNVNLSDIKSLLLKNSRALMKA